MIFFFYSLLIVTHTRKLILQYCKQVENTGDDCRALQLAQTCNFMWDGEPTREGRVVASVVQSNEEVTYYKVKQICELLDKSDKKVPENQPISS